MVVAVTGCMGGRTVVSGSREPVEVTEGGSAAAVALATYMGTTSTSHHAASSFHHPKMAKVQPKSTSLAVQTCMNQAVGKSYWLVEDGSVHYGRWRDLLVHYLGILQINPALTDYWIRE